MGKTPYTMRLQNFLLTTGLGLFACLSFVACSKQSATPGNTTPGSGSTGNTQSRTPTISVALNNTPMTVTGISYNRSGSTYGDFNFSAWNPLQKVDVYCFWFYEQSGFDYQFSDSINYSTRPDTLTAWTTTRASNWGDVNFDCCVAPLQDSVIPGEYSGNFVVGNASGGKSAGTGQGLTITGNFYLLFGSSASGH
jgi:hypothetical protein